MNFIDTARLHLKGGDGGDGCLSFHREKFVPRGGPNGGNGGKGGDVWLVADEGLTTLQDQAARPHLTAASGENGKGNHRHGPAGEDLVARVPAGTVVVRDGKLVADLGEPGQRFLAARGGRGGRGNASFKTGRNTAPKLAEKGEPGEALELELELKLLADVGLVGLPNAGKSTFLSRVSNARPKIADYPFTTLVPNLGLVRHRDRSFVLADIPGLIEGAHQGKGLGSAFLRHIERTRVLIHLVDPSGFGGKDPLACVRAIEAELKAFGHGLASKPRILALNKGDLPEAEAALKALRRSRKGVLLVSAATGAGLEAALDRAVRELERTPPPRVAAEPAAERPVLRIEKGVLVRRAEDGAFVVTGPRVERLAAMTRFDLEESRTRFQNILKKMGVERELRAGGVREGDAVRIGPLEFEWFDKPPALPEAERPSDVSRRDPAPRKGRTVGRRGRRRRNS